MKPAPYALLRSANLQEILKESALNETHKLVAGGQSLGAMLNLRLVRVDALYDLKICADLTRISVDSQRRIIGSMVTHAQLEDLPEADVVSQILSHVASGIAYRAIRNCGTIGGSLCHADPAADWVSSMALLDAELVVQRQDAKRSLPADGFMTFPFETTLQVGEVLTEVHIRQRSQSTQWSYRKHCRKTGEFALAIAGVLSDPETEEFRLVFGALDGPPLVVAGDAAKSLVSKSGRDEIASMLSDKTSSGQIDLHMDLLRQVALDIGVSS